MDTPLTLEPDAPVCTMDVDWPALTARLTPYYLRRAVRRRKAALLMLAGLVVWTLALGTLNARLNAAWPAAAWVLLPSLLVLAYGVGQEVREAQKLARFAGQVRYTLTAQALIAESGHGQRRVPLGEVQRVDWRAASPRMLEVTVQPGEALTLPDGVVSQRLYAALHGA